MIACWHGPGPRSPRRSLDGPDPIPLRPMVFGHRRVAGFGLRRGRGSPGADRAYRRPGDRDRPRDDAGGRADSAAYSQGVGQLGQPARSGLRLDQQQPNYRGRVSDRAGGIAGNLTARHRSSTSPPRSRPARSRDCCRSPSRRTTPPVAGSSWTTPIWGTTSKFVTSCSASRPVLGAIRCSSPARAAKLSGADAAVRHQGVPGGLNSSLAQTRAVRLLTGSSRHELLIASITPHPERSEGSGPAGSFASLRMRMSYKLSAFSLSL
jgi:hypothetical protein